MASDWTADDFCKIITIVTACLCLAAVVIGAMAGVLMGIISPEALGRITAAGVGTGILGLAYISYKVISVCIGMGGAAQ